MKDLLDLPDRKAWRAWLEKNHASVREAWLVYWKKASGKPRISYDDAVREALCFGWIDGKAKSLDADKFAQRFTPRNPKSRWSALNVRRAKRMIEEGLMTPAGLEAFSGHEKRATPTLPTALPAPLKKRFQREKKAWANFEGFSPSYRKMCIGWVASAKKEETQLRRLETLIRHSAANEKIEFM